MLPHDEIFLSIARGWYLVNLALHQNRKLVVSFCPYKHICPPVGWCDQNEQRLGDSKVIWDLSVSNHLFTWKDAVWLGLWCYEFVYMVSTGFATFWAQYVEWDMKYSTTGSWLQSSGMWPHVGITLLEEPTTSILRVDVSTKLHGVTFQKIDICTLCLLQRIGERRGAYRALVGKSEGRRRLERPRPRWEDNIKMDLRELNGGAKTGSIWLRIGTGDRLLWIRWWTFEFQKMRVISWVA